MDKSIYDQFKACCLQHPHDLAARFEKHTWTYAKLDKAITRTASKLLTLGVKKGDPVAVCMPNCPEALFLFYATSEIGAISYFIHPLTPALQLQNFLSKSGAKIVFVLCNRANDYSEGLPADIRLVSVNPYHGRNLFKYLALEEMSHVKRGIRRYGLLKARSQVIPAQVRGAETAVYLNTGGTNGEPKIIELSNDAINNLGMKGYPLIGGDVRKIKMLTAIPLFHGFGLVMGVHTPLSNGASTVLMLKFRTKEAIHYIQKGQATVIIGVPALYNALLSKDSFYGPWLEKQIIAFIGGDSVPPSLLERWNEAMEKYHSPARLYEGYGLTEAVNVCNVNTKAHHKKGTVGLPLVGLHEIIVDPETGKEVAPNHFGELYISGDSLMTGYLHDPELTAKTFVALGGEKFVATKDYCAIDEEGYLTYKQRMRRIVKVSGEGVCPSDVEKVALSFYEIYEAYCYGVPDERKGSILRLAIVIRRGYESADIEELKKSIYACLEERLTANCRPEKIIVLPKLPRTPVGKIDDAAMAQLEQTAK
jgi:long-chain acyl-CoA synthetase